MSFIRVDKNDILVAIKDVPATIRNSNSSNCIGFIQEGTEVVFIELFREFFIVKDKDDNKIWCDNTELSGFRLKK